MALQDKIGREEIVDKICGLVGSLKKDKNFCLAINGAWGSGKSFVLSMIEEKLSQKFEYIVIKYDAWENSFYNEPLIAILSCIIDCLESKLTKMKGYGKVAADFGNKKGKETIDKLSECGGKIGFIANIIKDFIEIVPNLKNVSLTTDTKDVQLETFRSYKALLREVKELLNKLTRKVLTENKQTKLVILVDEIDRCLPDEQLKILERMHHLFDVKNCAVIITMNQACVAKTVNTIYGIDGYEYLRKFFNFSFKLNTFSSVYLKNLLDDYMKNFEKIQMAEKNIEFSIKLAYRCLIYGDKRVINKADNRELTHFFDGLMNISNDFGWQNLNQHYVFFIILALYIRKMLSSSFLDGDKIFENQRNEFNKLKKISQYERNHSMPFYDYILEFLGVNRLDQPADISRFCQFGCGQFAEESWKFNEIIFYSMGTQFFADEISDFYSPLDGNPKEYEKLRRLVIFYGGEQEKCEK